MNEIYRMVDEAPTAEPSTPREAALGAATLKWLSLYAKGVAKEAEGLRRREGADADTWQPMTFGSKVLMVERAARTMSAIDDMAKARLTSRISRYASYPSTMYRTLVSPLERACHSSGICSMLCYAMLCCAAIVMP